MTKQMARLLKTDIMADLDLKTLAQLLKSRGKGRDTVLAHITPEEAQLLKDEGGSGTINEETGLPQFEDSASVENSAPEKPAIATPVSDTEQPYQSELPAEQAQSNFIDTSGGATSLGNIGLPQSYQGTAPGAAPSVVTLPQDQQDIGAKIAQQAGATQTTEQPTKPGFLDSLTQEQKLKLGLGGGSALLTGLLGKRAMSQTKAAADQQRALGAPLVAQGQEMMSKAQQGQLGDAQQQQYQAAQAQLASAQAKSGGVGAAQAATQLAAFRNQLLDAQLKAGQNLYSQGNAYVQNAIKMGLTGDQQLAQMLQGMTGSITSMFGGQPTRPTTPVQ